MSTVPSGEARAANQPKQDGTPNGPMQRSQGQFPADVPAASGTAASAAQQDVSQAPVTSATSGDKDNKPDVVPEQSKKPKQVAAALFVPQPPGALQTSMSLNNPKRDRPPQQHQDTKATQSLLIFQHGEKETPQTGRVTNRELDLAPSPLSVEAQSPQNVEVLPASLSARWSAVDANGQSDAQEAGSTAAVKGTPGEPQAWNPEADVSPSEEPQVVMEVNLADSSKDPWLWSFPPTPVGSMPQLPDLQEEALGRRPLDSSLYLADEENDYMRSMTSLLGGGEGSISSLADILVWSDAAMGMATSFLGSGHGSVSDLLHSPGPSLRPVSSLLGNASSAFSSGLATGTGSAFRSVTNMLGAMERRTVEGMRSAMRFFSGLFAPHRAPASPNCD
ncbi:testis-expressed protein 44 [Choloepus didactylus]|uniref:testis-expressed protein 44 n=1 Tax=Choloepus didactylus TaxID=27675 RepID=UPI0018A03F68|nr:testis-expressed protein 44 [Choloepus didactylus]